MSEQSLKPIQILSWGINRLAQIADYSWSGDFCKEEAQRAMTSIREEFSETDFRKMSIEELQQLGFAKWTENSLLCPLWAQPILKPNAKDKDIRGGCIAEGWEIKDGKVIWENEGDIFSLDKEGLATTQNTITTNTNFMKQIIGKCSKCGGTVIQESMGYTTDPKYFEPTCSNCGAQRKLPTIEMEECSQIFNEKND